MVLSISKVRKVGEGGFTKESNESCEIHRLTCLRLQLKFWTSYRASLSGILSHVKGDAVLQ
jgi:hypothetical protein